MKVLVTGGKMIIEPLCSTHYSESLLVGPALKSTIVMTRLLRQTLNELLNRFPLLMTSRGLIGKAYKLLGHGLGPKVFWRSKAANQMRNNHALNARHLDQSIDVRR